MKEENKIGMTLTLTKVIVTVSPFTDSEEIIKGFLREGVRAFRINFSHGSARQHEKVIFNIRKYSREMGIISTVCLDTRGPELRVEIANTSEIPLEKGDEVTFSNVRTPNGVFLQVPDFTEIPVGSKIYLDDGMLAIEVLKTTTNECKGVALNSHRLKNNKKVCFPGTVFSNTSTRNKDKADIKLAVDNNIDTVFASFMNTKKEVEEIRGWINNKDILLFSKIETLRGFKNIDEIIEASDGIMIARGDLGVEMNYSEMFSTQKIITEKCIAANKPVICATQMLETMIHNIKPSRAEITDVGNAVLDKFDALMLSGETAVGDHPVLTVTTMKNIIKNAETYLFESSGYKNKCPLLSPRVQNACVIIKSSSMRTILNFHRKHFAVSIFVVSNDKEFLSKLNLYRGIIPFYSEGSNMLNIINEIKNIYSFDKLHYLELTDNDSMKRLEIF